MNIFLILLCFGFTEFLISLLYIHMYKKQSKKCNYHCSMCKIWDCPAHHCNKQREKEW